MTNEETGRPICAGILIVKNMFILIVQLNILKIQGEGSPLPQRAGAHGLHDQVLGINSVVVRNDRRSR